MKTKRTWIFATAMCMTWASQGQDWHANPPGNVLTLGTEWMGALPGSLIPVRIKTVEDLAIEMYTTDIRRATLLPDATYTIGSFAGLVKDGCLLHSPNVDQFYSLGGPGPFSIDHVAAADDNAEQQFYRPWMHVGTTYTGNKDQGYVGQKAGDEGGKTDMVLHFSGPTDGSQQNHVRAIYTSGYSAATTGAGSAEGLEFLRLWPRDADQPHVGIGDWYAANITSGGLITEPQERLDVVNGNVRVRDLPTQPQSTSTDVVVVASNGNLERRPASSLTTSDCEWTMSMSAPNHVVTAYSATPDANCPDAAEFVGIGTPTPLYKLDVKHTAGSSGSQGGIRSQFWSGNSGTAYGINSLVDAENNTDLDQAHGIRSVVNSVRNGGNGLWATVNLDWSGANNTGSQTSGVQGNVTATAGTYGTVFGTRGEISTTTNATISSAYGSLNKVTGSGAVANAFGCRGESNVTGAVSNNYGVSGASIWGTGATVPNLSIGVDGSSGPSGTTTPVGTSIGVAASASHGNLLYGVRARANNGTIAGSTTYGVHGQSYGANALNAYGVYGIANGSATTNYGVYGTAANGTGSTNPNWAGYFQGNIWVSGTPFSTAGGTWTASDAALKMNPQPIADATDLVLELQPKTYEFQTAEYPGFHLPTGTQAGFYAQELEQVLPLLVQEVAHPAQYDSAGVETAPAMDLKTVNYTGVIPYLVAAFQEQHARIDALEAEVLACCSSTGRAARSSVGSLDAVETDLRIIPNPVADRTELRYTVGAEGRVRLEITDASGRMIQVQDEGTRATGSFSYGWDTTLLAAGTYFCTLYVNDEPLVKKAVKLNAR